MLYRIFEFDESKYRYTPDRVGLHTKQHINTNCIANFYEIKYSKIISFGMQLESITRIRIPNIFDNDNQCVNWKIYQKITKMQ